MRVLLSLDTRAAIPAEEAEGWPRSVPPCLLQLLDLGLSAHWAQEIREPGGAWTPGRNPGEETGLDLGDSSWFFCGFPCRANPREAALCALASPLTSPGPLRVNVSTALPAQAQSKALPGWKRLTGNEERKAGMCQTPGKH